MKILYAEDDKFTRDLTVEMLSRGGITVIPTKDGADTWKEYVEGDKDYDLLLLDNRMPEKTGLEILKEIRERGDNIPVVILTSLIEQQMYDLGVDACFDKSVRYDELIRELEAIVARGRRPISSLLPPKKKTFFEKFFGKKK